MRSHPAPATGTPRTHAPDAALLERASLVEFRCRPCRSGRCACRCLPGAYLRLLPDWVSARALDYHLARGLPLI